MNETIRTNNKLKTKLDKLIQESEEYKKIEEKTAYIIGTIEGIIKAHDTGIIQNEDTIKAIKYVLNKTIQNDKWWKK